MKKKILIACATLMLFVGISACTPNNTDTTPDINNAFDMNATFDELSAAYGEEGLPARQKLDETTLKDMYGIDAADLEEWIAEMPMMNVQVDEFFIAKVKPGKMETVKAGIEKRAKDLDTQWSTYLPDKYEIVKNHKIVENGDYIMFTVSEIADKHTEIFNSKFN